MTHPVPSDSQRSAIEAEPQPLLVLAGPGAGKTYCLIERIRFLVEQRGFDPARICAFTFTNKAAGEIASRLEKHLGANAERIKRGTIHSFCAELLREFGTQVGLEPGFGIADEDYQLRVLSRIEGYRRWHRQVLTRFSGHRFRGDELQHNDRILYERYRDFLTKRNLLDFDMLVLKTAELMRIREVAQEVSGRYTAILVDEFQDLNPVQYMVIHALTREHRNIFAVGDDEQSIYSWAGADPEVFLTFVNDFGVITKQQLGENRRCPAEVVTLARLLLMVNTPIFADRRHAEAEHSSPFPVTALSFRTEDEEIEWILADIKRDKKENNLDWGDFALLYRTHEIGNAAEAAFLAAGLPCRLAHGRALADDPIVSYVVNSLRVIAAPGDPIHQEGFLKVVLPKSLFEDARVKAEEQGQTLMTQLVQMARDLPREHGDRRKIWRSFYALRNLAALGATHKELSTLVDELLSQRVGEYRTVLEENHDELSDPAEHDEVQVLAERLTHALDNSLTIWIPRLGGLEIALKGILAGIGLNRVQLGGTPPRKYVGIGHSDAPYLGIGLGLFKAAQLIRSSTFSNHFRDFTAVDLETTDNDTSKAEIVEIAAVKVRGGAIVSEYQSLVKPRVQITAGAYETHHISAEEVADKPYFEEIWPAFREFCGQDVLVAHNGHRFDFPIIRRMSAGIPGAPFVTYDTLLLARELHTGSAKLVDLANHFGVDPGKSHRALDDTRALALVFLALGEAKVARARKTALDNLLDYLGIALALTNDASLGEEARRLKKLTRTFALGRYTNCLDVYREDIETSKDETITSTDDLIDLLGGEALMLRLRGEKTADQRYPAAMQRLRPLFELFEEKPLAEQISGFLERIALSKMDGVEPETARVNLLTLHSTKGLEFSRVYVVGAEDSALPGGKDPGKREIEEARRLLYVGMTRTKERLVLTRVDERNEKPTGGNRFLDEMHLLPVAPD
ncbi:MAG TPA: UvrD-helicase domain-containing protein [Gemmatimonadaceae bacterium]|nr:UvrD-helicase domain-containing protein [Gemmatimonadaceae bacterium]